MTDPGPAPVDKRTGVQPIPIAFAPILDTRRPIIEHCPYCHQALVDEDDHIGCYDPPEPEPEYERTDECSD